MLLEELPAHRASEAVAGLCPIALLSHMLTQGDSTAVLVGGSNSVAAPSLFMRPMSIRRGSRSAPSRDGRWAGGSGPIRTSPPPAPRGGQQLLRRSDATAPAHGRGRDPRSCSTAGCRPAGPRGPGSACRSPGHRATGEPGGQGPAR